MNQLFNKLVLLPGRHVFINAQPDKSVGSGTKNVPYFITMQAAVNWKRRVRKNRWVYDIQVKMNVDMLCLYFLRYSMDETHTLQTVRELKSVNVEVIFEKENLHTFDPKCEMMLTIMSSLAQEESRSISENVRWGKQKSMQEGNVSMPYRRFLGYRKGEDGRPEIVEEEAEIVRRIYTMFLDGKTIRQIGEQLTSEGIPTPAGKKVWSVSTIKSILTNEKYRGDALLQKTYTVDYLSKEKRKNQGEVKQYLVENSHEPIIDPETFDKVQEKMKVHSANRRKLKSRRGLARSIICGECGAYYGRKVWHNNSNTKRYDVWYCNHKYGKDKEGSCQTPVLKESEIGKAFTEAMTKSGNPNPTYSEERWKEMVKTATVFTDRSMVIEWKDGGKTTVQI